LLLAYHIFTDGGRSCQHRCRGKLAIVLGLLIKQLGAKFRIRLWVFAHDPAHFIVYDAPRLAYLPLVRGFVVALGHVLPRLETIYGRVRHRLCTPAIPRAPIGGAFISARYVMRACHQS